MPTLLIDDPNLLPEATVYRRVGWNHVGGVDRFEPGEKPSLSSNMFKDYPAARAEEYGFAGPCMSVGLGYLIEEHGKTPAEAMLGNPHQGYGLVACTVGDLRALQRLNGDACPQGIMPAPTDHEPWHAVVFDVTGKRAESVSAAIAKIACWIVPLIRAP